MISLRQIRYFVAVAKSGSFSAAAQIAHVSQPSLCVQMKQLEQEIGAKLLSRHARGKELGAGVLRVCARGLGVPGGGWPFCGAATAALKEIKRAEEAVAALNAAHAAEISLGVTPTSGRALVADLLCKSKESARAPRLLFREGLSDELWKLVAEGELDAGVCYDPSYAPTVRIVPLYQEDLFLVGPRNVLPDADAVDRAALGNFPLVLGYRGHHTRHFIEAAARGAGADLCSVEEIEPRTLKRELLVRHGRCSIVPY